MQEAAAAAAPLLRVNIKQQLHHIRVGKRPIYSGTTLIKKCLFSLPRPRSRKERGVFETVLECNAGGAYCIGKGGAQHIYGLLHSSSLSVTCAIIQYHPSSLSILQNCSLSLFGTLCQCPPWHPLQLGPSPPFQYPPQVWWVSTFFA